MIIVSVCSDVNFVLYSIFVYVFVNGIVFSLSFYIRFLMYFRFRYQYFRYRFIFVVSCIFVSIIVFVDDKYVFS